MSAWRKSMKPVLVGGVSLAGVAMLALALAAGGCESRPFTKKVVRRPEPTIEKKDVNRQELEELLSIK